jgi:hypothetical protein
MAPPLAANFSWERMIRAVEKVRERLLRATAALEKAGLPYAVGGGNAVAAWVARVDESAVRNTPDVDVLLGRSDFEAAKAALTSAGFVHERAGGVDHFLDGPQGKVRDAVHVAFASENVRADHVARVPTLSEATPAGSAHPFRVLPLEALVQMMLTSYRRLDRVLLRDLIDVGLLDADWCPRLPPELAARLQELIEDPEG